MSMFSIGATGIDGQLALRYLSSSYPDGRWVLDPLSFHCRDQVFTIWPSHMFLQLARPGARAASRRAPSEERRRRELVVDALEVQHCAANAEGGVDHEVLDGERDHTLHRRANFRHRVLRKHRRGPTVAAHHVNGVHLRAHRRPWRRGVEVPSLQQMLLLLLQHLRQVFLQQFFPKTNLGL